MAFFTTLKFYRPTAPASVSGEALAAFIGAFDKLGVASVYGKLSVDLKFGKAIDADKKPAHWLEPIGNGIATTAEIRWDVSARCGSLEDVIGLIKDRREPLYRAYVQLGNAVDEVTSGVQRIGSPENEVSLTLDSWSLELGPIHTSSLSVDDSIFVGWMSLNLSGYGYLYPWSFVDLVRRAEAVSAIAKVTSLCRATWPVTTGKPGRRERYARNKMGDLWPYPSKEMPLDWYWGLSEG
ncbi:MAG TPA: hypothetical protein VFI31_17515 [Pirellulales bacterium]|nr:hypothetical protein [Pirellulales bacterium]